MTQFLEWDDKPKHTYISFASDETGFLGAVVVDVVDPDPAVALRMVDTLGLNPGGQAALVVIRAGDFPTNVLLTRDKLFAAGAKRLGDMEDSEREKVEDAVAMICQQCNVGHDA